MKFNASIWARAGEFSVYPINTVEGAGVFLEEWPAEQRGPLYYMAANAVEACKAGNISPNEVRDILVTFLDDAKALAEERMGV